MQSLVAIAAKNVSKTYGTGLSAFTALKDISFGIAQGESVAITGKSGSGKSTLMHLLALMDEPTSGSIYIGDNEAKNMSEKGLDTLRNQTFGFVFQQFFLNGGSTVLENVILPLKIAGIPKGKRTEMGLQALGAVEIRDKANNRASDLSGGQKQRVCIARALINKPSIIFADEPTGNLDTATGEVITKLLFDLNKKQNITLIIVTHDPDLARRCDRQLEIRDGNMVGAAK